MSTATQTTEELKEKIRNDLDRLDGDDIREICSLIARRAGEKASRLATVIWDREKLSREKINQTVQTYRNSKK